MMSKETFESLTPRERGYTVYMAGCHPDQPNVPNEKNPYQKGTIAREEWDKGQELAVTELLDCDDD